jgi:hypothetical protein
MRRLLAVANREDAPVESLQLAGLDPSRYGAPADPKSHELAMGDHTVLPPGDLRESAIRVWVS